MAPRRVVGSRVAAVSHGTGDEIFIFGYGVYEGDFVPGDDAQGMLADMCRETKLKNPRIRLDNGDVVYGCECWWGPEDVVRKKFEGKTIVEISIHDARKKASRA